MYPLRRPHKGPRGIDPATMRQLAWSVMKVIRGSLMLAFGLASLPGCRSVLGIESTEVDPASCRLVTQRVFFADKPAEDTQVRLGALTKARFQTLAADLGVPLDAARGHALIEIRDCQDEPASARARLLPTDAEATLFATRGEALSLATGSGVEGATGALNLSAPEEYEVTAYPEELSVESSQSDLVVRAGELSRVVLAPNSEVMVTPPAADEWTCVGIIAEPVPTKDTVTFTIEVRTATTLLPDGDPVGGVRVIICRDDAASCAADAAVAPGDEAFTDDTGRALLQVSTAGGAFDGHLVVSGTDPNCDR